MNQLRAWLYGQDLPVKSRQNSGITSESQDPSRVNTLVTTGQETYKSGLHNILNSKIPLAPGDCLECKLVGTGVMMLSGLIIMTSAVTARKHNPGLVGIRGAIYFMVCGNLFMGFETMAVCRLMDWGPFKKVSPVETTK